MSEEKYLKLLKERWAIYSDVFGMKNFENRLDKRITSEGGRRSLVDLQKIVNIQDKKILDVGSCCGEFLFEAVKNGAMGYGIEPDKLSLEVSELLFKNNNKDVVLKNAKAENIPFQNNTFDIVVSIFIIEHVKDYEKAILEMYRVLKPGGILWLKCPNYLYPYERHYKRYYFPFLPKFIQQIYFNLLSGKKTKYFQKLNLITPNKILKILKKNNIKFRDLSKEKVRDKGLFYKLLHRINIYPIIDVVIHK